MKNNQLMQISWRQSHTLPFKIHPWNSNNLEIVASIVNRHVNDHMVHLKSRQEYRTALQFLGLPDYSCGAYNILLIADFLWLGFTCSKLALKGYLFSLFGLVLDFKSRGTSFKSHLGWNVFFWYISCFLFHLVLWPSPGTDQ